MERSGGGGGRRAAAPSGVFFRERQEDRPRAAQKAHANIGRFEGDGGLLPPGGPHAKVAGRPRGQEARRHRAPSHPARASPRNPPARQPRPRPCPACAAPPFSSPRAPEAPRPRLLGHGLFLLIRFSIGVWSVWVSGCVGVWICGCLDVLIAAGKEATEGRGAGFQIAVRSGPAGRGRRLGERGLPHAQLVVPSLGQVAHPLGGLVARPLGNF